MTPFRTTLAAAVVAWASPCLAQAPAQAQWVTLGTAGGPPIRATQSQIANALVVGDATYLFDTGAGTLRQLAAAKLPIGRVRVVFLTHHHVDHVTDLGPVIISRWSIGGDVPPLRVIGPPGAKQMADGLAAAYAPVALAAYPINGPVRPPVSVSVQAADLPRHIDTPTLVYHDDRIKVWAISVNHFDTPPSVPMAEMPTAVSYRIEAAGRTIAYTGDTGFSPAFIRLAKGADLMVSEVVDIDSARAAAARNGPIPPMMEATYRNWQISHVSPSEVGEMAAKAGVKEVVLTHYVGVWETNDLSGYEKGVRDNYRGTVKLAHDLDRF